MTQRFNKSVWLVAAALATLPCALYAQKNVVQPGDPILASSANSPGSEGVANAIDGTQAKYLNRDSANDAKTSGFVVTPSVGVTWVTGIAMESANDAPDRDPKEITLEGSNDDTIASYSAGTWEQIVDLQVPVFSSRYQWQTFSFSNFKPYKHYRWTVVHTAGPSGCCMQISEVQLLGTVLPKNVVQPGDPILASSANSPGSEGVANAIDGTQAKYLNRDLANDAIPAGFIVTPSVGSTVVQGISMTSANDAPDRDPKSITLEGSNDDAVTSWSSGNWTLIYSNASVPVFATRYQNQTFLFNNVIPYKHYRWTVLHTAGPSGCCMQIAEVLLLGTGAPKNVVQPGDAVIASSANSPGSEGVANAIDGTQAKYLNRDSANDAKTSGFVVTPSVGATTITGLAMETANDAPDRDPKQVTVEGSNDDTITDFNSGNWTVIADLQVPATATRYAWQYFYFQNSTSYKHYRWTVLHTAGPSGCCMQIAEVQFLAVTSQTDCKKAHFLVQPVDTPVLPGSQATFFVAVNGPWPLQWYRGTNAIPGATATSFTTDPVTTANSNLVYSVNIVGCEASTPVRAVLFTPSSTKSIGMHFIGSGANGAPTPMLTDDIAGIQPQAYWNNVTNSSVNAGTTGDGATMADVLTDSDNSPSTITFEFSTSGHWGAGTGTDSPTTRLLNGIAGAAGTGTEQTVTFHNVPAGNHSVLVYAVSPPQQFQQVSYTIGATTYYLRVMNSDEYKPAPGFYRGSSTDPKNPSIADFVRFDNVSPNASGDVNLAFNTLQGAAQATGVNGVQLVLNAPNPGAPPVITADPQPGVGPTNGTVQLTVQATGNNLTYQWRKAGRNLPNGGHVSGATTATLTLSSLSADDEGVYSVAVFNPAGSVVSKNATVYLSKYDIKAALAGYWKFDETSGATAANAVAGGVAVAVNGTAAWGKGQVGNALSFDGSSTYGVVSSYPKATKAISAAGWVNVASSASAGVAFVRNAEGNLGVGVAQSGAPAGQFELGLALDATSGMLSLSAGVGAGPNIYRATAPTAFPLGAWQHVALTADGAQLRLYLNGVEVANQAYLADLIVPEVQYLSLGARLNQDTSVTPPILGPDPTTPGFMIGQLDDFAVWNRALTASEIGLVYAAGQQGKAADTVVETPTTQPPKLTVTLAAGRLTISWDPTATGFTLEGTPTLTSPTWTTISGVANNSVSLTVPATGSQFYRLRK